MAIFRIPVGLNWTGIGGPGVNVWNVRTVTGAGGAGSPLDLASQAIKNLYTSMVAQYCSTTTAVYSGEATEVGVADPQRVTSPVWTVTGTGTTSTAPQLLQIVASVRTSSATRSGSGRIFLGPLTTSTVQIDGTPVDSYLTTMRTGLAALLAASVASNGWAVGVYSRKQNLFRDATAFIVKDRFSYLSSRRD